MTETIIEIEWLLMASRYQDLRYVIRRCQRPRCWKNWPAHLFKTSGIFVSNRSSITFQYCQFTILRMSEHFPMVRCCGLTQHYYCILLFSCGLFRTASLLRNLHFTFCIFHFKFSIFLFRIFLSSIFSFFNNIKFCRISRMPV